MTDAPDLSAEAVEKLARNVMYVPMWHSSIAASTLRALSAEILRLRAEIAAIQLDHDSQIKQDGIADQARDLAVGIIAAVDIAEAHQ